MPRRFPRRHRRRRERPRPSRGARRRVRSVHAPEQRVAQAVQPSGSRHHEPGLLGQGSVHQRVGGRLTDDLVGDAFRYVQPPCEIGEALARFVERQPHDVRRHRDLVRRHHRDRQRQRVHHVELRLREPGEGSRVVDRGIRRFGEIRPHDDGAELLVARPCDEHRARRGAHDALGDAAQEEVGGAGAAMGPHDDRVRLDLPGVGGDRVGGAAAQDPRRSPRHRRPAPGPAARRGPSRHPGGLRVRCPPRPSCPYDSKAGYGMSTAWTQWSFAPVVPASRIASASAAWLVSLKSVATTITGGCGHVGLLRSPGDSAPGRLSAKQGACQPCAGCWWDERPRPDLASE